MATDGGIFAFGDAGFYGSTGGMHLNQPIVGMAATPDGHGYWLVAPTAASSPSGTPRFYGSTGGIAPQPAHRGHGRRPPTGAATGWWPPTAASSPSATPASTARPAAMHLNRPIVGMAADQTGGGYWLVASDGGIFSFGDAAFYGSTGGQHLNQPIVGMAIDLTVRGYWLVAADGGIFTFGDAASARPARPARPIVGWRAGRALPATGHARGATDLS